MNEPKDKIELTGKDSEITVEAATDVLIAKAAYELNQDAIHFSLSHAANAMHDRLLQRHRNISLYHIVTLDYIHGDRFMGRAKTIVKRRQFGMGRNAVHWFQYIILVPKGLASVEFDAKGDLLSDCERFIVGHELGHLDLHFEHMINAGEDGRLRISSTCEILDPLKELEAGTYGQDLSVYRDIHSFGGIGKLAERYNLNKDKLK